MRTHIFSYVIPHDYGFAPNPYGGFLTLATCKPKIRRSARVGDYIAGTGSVETVGADRLVYAGKVTAIVPIEDYGRLRKYSLKRPSRRSERWRRYGDNIYHLVDGDWKQRRNPYHGDDAKNHDLSGVNVLICDQFWYYGQDAITIPVRLRGVIKKGPSHKRIREVGLVQRFIDWLESLPDGMIGSTAEDEDHNTTTCTRGRHGEIC
tara:strand:+ start:2486 stop:3103 length:618 start_codon:yes stop_codon:yes gene_type:complete